MGNKNLIVLFFYVLMILKVDVIYIGILYVIVFFFRWVLNLEKDWENMVRVLLYLWR